MDGMGSSLLLLCGWAWQGCALCHHGGLPAPSAPSQVLGSACLDVYPPDWRALTLRRINRFSTFGYEHTGKTGVGSCFSLGPSLTTSACMCALPFAYCWESGRSVPLMGSPADKTAEGSRALGCFDGEE